MSDGWMKNLPRECIIRRTKSILSNLFLYSNIGRYLLESNIHFCVELLEVKQETGWVSSFVFVLRYFFFVRGWCNWVTVEPWIPCGAFSHPRTLEGHPAWQDWVSPPWASLSVVSPGLEPVSTVRDPTVCVCVCVCTVSVHVYECVRRRR